MIIIAQPKSASSSVYHSLGQILRWPACQDFIRLDPSVWCRKTNPREFPHMACLHSDAVGQIERDRVAKWCADGYIFKQHTPPTVHNLGLFAPFKVVFLSRIPRDSAQGYLRSKAQNHLKANEQKYFDGVRSELVQFRDGWRTWGSSRPDTFLELTYAQIVAHQRKSMQAICDFWETGIKVPEDFVLSKKRYTREPSRRRK